MEGLTPTQETRILIWEGIAAQARKDAAAMIKYAERYEAQIEELRNSVESEGQSESDSVHDTDLCELSHGREAV